MMIKCLIFMWGVLVGIAWASREDPTIVPRFANMDQRRYERWQGYCELDKRTKESSNAGL